MLIPEQKNEPGTLSSQIQRPPILNQPIKAFILTIVTLLLCASCSDRTPPEPEAQGIRPAKIMTVKRETGTVTYEFTGRIEAVQTIDVSFQVSGPLQTLSVREGTTIKKGTLIAAIEPTDFELAVREAEVELRLASQDLDRKRKVLRDNGIAESRVDDAQSNFDLKSVKLEKVREQLADTKIYAPFTAYVSRRYLDNFVNIRASDPIVRLLDLNKLLVVINIPEKLLATVSADQVNDSWATFSFAKDKRFQIQYRENRGEAESLAQTYEVSYTMDNPPSFTILPGMTATVSVELRGDDNGQILLPASAIVPAPNDYLTVWLFDPSTQLVKRRLIKTGPPTKAGVPILEGLSEGDQVVTTGASQLQSGMRIRRL